MKFLSYVLVSAVRNEESYIEKTIQAVVSQTVKPRKWTIVNDGSTDRTGEIISQYSLKHDFIQLLNRKSENIRNFASKVYAIKEGLKSFQGMDYDLIGNIDGDIEFDPGYFECLLDKFRENYELGIAGGWIYEWQNGKYKERFGNAEHSVPGSVQTFRRECFERIGTYLPIKSGGEDCIAEVLARMHGWSTRSFPYLRVIHHRTTGTAKTGVLTARYRRGKEDYFLGYHPLFELLKCLKGYREKPFIIANLLSFIGYTSSLLNKEPISVPQHVIEYLRKEQLGRIRSMIEKIKFR